MKEKTQRLIAATGVLLALLTQMVPLIESGSAGLLGVLQLPRLWLKLLLESLGMLDKGYPGAGKGYDQMAIDALGLDRGDVVKYIVENKPTYLQIGFPPTTKASPTINPCADSPQPLRKGNLDVGNLSFKSLSP